MAEVQWIKLVTNVFDNRKIRLIETMPEGDTIIVIWFKLLCMAGQTNDGGSVYFTKDIPFTDEMLSHVFSRPLQVIRLALKTFEQFGMIQVVDSFIQISSWEKYQNVEGLEKIREQTRLRVQKHREKQRGLMESNVCQYCGGDATGYDHIIPTTKGGTDEYENLVPSCIDCNRTKNDRPLEDFLNNNRSKIRDDLVANNEKLQAHIRLDSSNKYVTANVTLRNATEKNREEKNREEKKGDNKLYTRVIDHLNLVAGTRYKPSSKATQRVISARINEGFTVEDIIKVIDIKADDWKGTEFEKYLRPETLFGTKFEGYLNSRKEETKPEIQFLNIGDDDDAL